ncbi:DUF2635 domain-containing protein [Martelella alba]|uniref:DUF2635 domain-containing protein n=1 Tax=Martelella alba TaxID=2590451 RepID=A0ABY2SSR0_9HYPH|nr:DUF2635 domain-containing protein [Martelella alba]TKI08663.1 DUF2635 domain-containing protein [Martelella alba]
MKVKARTGISVPREDNPRRYITDAEALEVAESAYYLRRLAEGDLLRVTEAAPAAATSPTAETATAQTAADAGKGDK